MKKALFLILLFVTSLAASAQFKVYSSGNANVKCNTEYSMNKLSVGEYTSPSTFNSYQNGILSQTVVTSGKFNISLYGDSRNYINYNTGRAVGVLGVAGYSTSGYNYGVFGRLCGTQNGAGVYGSINDNMGSDVGGKYAGYFYGPTYVNGTLTATNVVTPSDIRLKENVVSLSDTEKGSTLENLLGMNVIEYNYKQREVPEAERDTLSSSRGEIQQQKEKHYGLSAQELQAIYPNLVKEGQDGYLGVNYVELVPVLIRAIQELKAELDAVKGIDTERKAPSVTSVSAAKTNSNLLYQNTPNPFKEQTTIRFSLADDVHDASICIFDMTGKMLKKLPISSGDSSVSVNGWELGEGMFLYSLVVNGKEIDTKKMVLSK